MRHQMPTSRASGTPAVQIPKRTGAAAKARTTYPRSILSARPGTPVAPAAPGAPAPPGQMTLTSCPASEQQHGAAAGPAAGRGTRSSTSKTSAIVILASPGWALATDEEMA